MWPASPSIPTELWQRFALIFSSVFSNCPVLQLDSSMNRATKLFIVHVSWHVHTQPRDKYCIEDRMKTPGERAMEKKETRCRRFLLLFWLLAVTLALHFAVCWWHRPSASFRRGVHGGRVRQLKNRPGGSRRRMPFVGYRNRWCDHL